MNNGGQVNLHSARERRGSPVPETPLLEGGLGIPGDFRGARGEPGKVGKNRLAKRSRPPLRRAPNTLRALSRPGSNT